MATLFKANKEAECLSMLLDPLPELSVKPNVEVHFFL